MVKPECLLSKSSIINKSDLEIKFMSLRPIETKPESLSGKRVEMPSLIFLTIFSFDSLKLV